MEITTHKNVSVQLGFTCPIRVASSANHTSRAWRLCETLIYFKEFTRSASSAQRFNRHWIFLSGNSQGPETYDKLRICNNINGNYNLHGECVNTEAAKQQEKNSSQSKLFLSTPIKHFILGLFNIFKIFFFKKKSQFQNKNTISKPKYKIFLSKNLLIKYSNVIQITTHTPPLPLPTAVSPVWKYLENCTWIL